MSKAATKIRSAFRRVTLSRPLLDVYDRLRPIDSLGQRGEIAAERYLLKLGMIIVARGYQNSFGEIDLIAVDERTVVFVEVKTRTTDQFGSPAEAVDEDKQSKLSKTGLAYLSRHKLLEHRARFDVISIVWNKDDKHPKIEHIRDAFEVIGDGQMFT